MSRYSRNEPTNPHEEKLGTRLEHWTSDVIKEYVSLLGGATTITRKAERIAYICDQMLTPNQAKKHWDSLSKVGRQAVSAAYHNNGIFNSQAFIAQYGTLPERPEKEQRSYFSYSFHNPIVYDLFVLKGSIAPDLAPLLADLVMPEDRFQITAFDVTPLTVRFANNENDEGDELPLKIIETETSGRIDLLTYLRMVDQGQVSFGRTNSRLTSGSVKKVFNQLIDGDFVDSPEKMTAKLVVRPVCLDVFVADSGMMTNRGNLSKTGLAFLETQDNGVFEEAFETWVETGRFEELSRVPGIKGLRSKKTKLTKPGSRREKIIEALSWCPAGKWIELEEFFRAMLIWNFDIDIEETSYYMLSIEEYWDLSSNEYYQLIEQPYIKVVLLEYLATLGLIDVGLVDYSDYVDGYYYEDTPEGVYDSFQSFRITNWGAYLLGQNDEYASSQPAEEGKFSIGEGLTLTLFDTALPGDKLLIETIGVPLGTDQYRLDTVKLLDAVDAGQSFAQYKSFLLNGLDKKAGNQPAALVKWLDTLEANLKAVKLKQKATVYTVNAAVAELLKTDKVLKSQGEMLSGSTVLVTSGKDGKFRKRLKELGYLVG